MIRGIYEAATHGHGEEQQQRVASNISTDRQRKAARMPPEPPPSSPPHDPETLPSPASGVATSRTQTSRAEVDGVAREPRGRAWQVLGHRDYALLFWGQLISAAGTQMQVVAVAWQVLLLTNSPVALGVIGLAQGIPRLVFSLIGGVFADALDRRKLLIVVNV